MGHGRVQKTPQLLVLLVALSLLCLLVAFSLPLSGRMMIKEKEVPRVALSRISLEEAPEVGGRLFHVTKEFGEASVGGMGSVLTALSAAQHAKGYDVTVILPAYTFLLTGHSEEVRPLVKVRVGVRTHSALLLPGPLDRLDPWGALRGALSPSGEGLWATAEVEVQVWEYRHGGVRVVLIGQGDRAPFHLAFRAASRAEVYQAARGFPWQLRDIFFSRAVAEYLAWEHARRPVGYVHLHGATNALVLPMAREMPSLSLASRARPAFIYTLHDYLDEMALRFPLDDVARFLPFPFAADPATHPLFGGSLFPSAYAIRGADVVTCVSESLAGQLLDGSLDFRMRPVLIEDLALKALQGRFFGIGNGVDFASFSPFSNPLLAGHGLEFPREGGISEKKRAAKALLVRLGVLSEEQAARDLALFIGRFQHNKGIELCQVAQVEFRRQETTFIMMGQDSPSVAWQMGEIRKEGALVIGEEEEQRRVGVIVRAAADLVLVPSRTEAFGLVAAEGMAFGSLVVSSGVGGLKDFLVDLRDSPSDFNSVNFDLGKRGDLERALRDAKQVLSLPGREELVQRLTRHALRLDWGRPLGPADRYGWIYTRAHELREALTLPPPRRVESRVS